MTKRPMERCSTSLVTKEMGDENHFPVKRMRHRFMPTRGRGRQGQKWDTSSVAGQTVKWGIRFRRLVGKFLKMLELWSKPSNSAPGADPRKLKTHVHRRPAR